MAEPTQNSKDSGKPALGLELMQHYPERKWSLVLYRFYLTLPIWVILVVGGVRVAWYYPTELISWVVLGLSLLVTAVGMIGGWMWYGRAEITLRADGITYSGWRRFLKFSDVEGVMLNPDYRNNGVLILFLKDRQPAFEKFSLPGLNFKIATISLVGYSQEPKIIEHFVRAYFQRQILEEGRE